MYNNICERDYSSAWLERYVDIVEVIGSNPISPTKTWGARYSLILNPQYVIGMPRLRPGMQARGTLSGKHDGFGRRPTCHMAGYKNKADGTTGDKFLRAGN